MLFLENGYLCSGIHYMSWNDFYEKFSFSPRRLYLLEGLARAIDILKQCGCLNIYINGSFVSQKLVPLDFDACWDGEFYSVYEKLKVYEPILLDFTNNRKKQKDKYKGEIFPAEFTADSKGTKYLEFFQNIRFSSDKKGIVSIKLQDHD